MATQLLRTRGAEETSAALASLYGRVSLSFPSVSSGLQIERDAIGELTLDRLRTDVRVGFDVQPLPMLSICQIRRGWTRIEPTTAGEPIGPGGIVIPGTVDRPFSAVTNDLDLDVTTFPQHSLNGVAATLLGPDVDPVRLTGHRPLSPNAGAQFARVRAYVLHSVRQLPANLGADATDLLVGSLTQLMAAAVLVAFPNTAVIEPTAADRRDAHPDSLRRAISFIESHPDVDLTVADIASAADVTPRALQLAFRRHLNTTPMAYLRRIRLDRAHADLRAATPADRASVTVIAARWGYARPSRFSADYLAAYGRHPQDTLRNARE